MQEIIPVRVALTEAQVTSYDLQTSPPKRPTAALNAGRAKPASLRRSPRTTSPGSWRTRSWSGSTKTA